jgi:hypothetical protein
VAGWLLWTQEMSVGNQKSKGKSQKAKMGAIKKLQAAS